MNDIVAEKYIDIEKNQYARIPGSPPGPDGYCLPGPAQLKVMRYRDGRVTHEVIQGVPKPIRFAVFHKMKLVSWGV